NALAGDRQLLVPPPAGEPVVPGNPPLWVHRELMSKSCDPRADVTAGNSKRPVKRAGPQTLHEPAGLASESQRLCAARIKKARGTVLVVHDRHAEIAVQRVGEQVSSGLPGATGGELRS